jgi:hypothetical protein
VAGGCYGSRGHAINGDTVSEEKIRVLICHTDGAVMELPWFEGNPDHDDTLKYRISQHKFPDGSAHFGNLFVYNKKDWNNSVYRQAILDEIAKQVKPGEGTGLGNTFYELKDTFTEDAIACWKGFGKTTDPGHCDYRKDNKRLYPDTKGLRKDLGLDPKDRPNTFLCDFCPVNSVVEGLKNKGKY